MNFGMMAPEGGFLDGFASQKSHYALSDAESALFDEDDCDEELWEVS